MSLNFIGQKTIMTSVITGDIIRSRKANPEEWLRRLKKELKPLGRSPRFWEIYGGDTFQVRVTDPLQALQVAIKIKSGLKTIKAIDVRMAIGLGEISYEASRITESNGTAFVNSGEKFELLKKEKINLAIKSPWEEFDNELNLYLKLSLIIMDKWTTNGAEMVQISLDNPTLSQEKLGKLLSIKQNAISNRLKRTNLETLMEVNELYKKKLKKLL